ncbi:hypothetical protein ZWY2020_050132 [Hordeum vulgare]|nr:hypothetical protein ZWY2020_050132 [Hordeum vulgare]
MCGASLLPPRAWDSSYSILEPVDIDPQRVDPMLNESSRPSPHILLAFIGNMGCLVLGDDVWLTHRAFWVGGEETVDPMCSEATFWSPRPGDSSLSSVVESLAHPMLSTEELLGFNEPNVMVESVVEVRNVVAKVSQTKAQPLSLKDFLSMVTCPLPQPLVGTPVPSHGKRKERRSERPDKKNKACNIPTSKRAEYMMLEIFGELPEVSKAQGPEQKMQAYVDMYKKPLSPQVIEALSSLVRIAGKSKFDLSECFSNVSR